MLMTHFPWTPQGKHELGAPSREHLKDHDIRGKEKFNLLGPRKGHLSYAYGTGRWWGGCPEQLCLFYERVCNTPFLGIAMLNREPMGHSWRRKEKPHQYNQSVRSFYYDLSSTKNVAAFLKTCRYVIGVAAARREEISERDYRLLCRSPIDGIVGARGERGEGFEEVYLVRNPQQAGCRDRYRFMIRRTVDLDDGRKAFGSTTINCCTVFSLPTSAARVLAENLPKMIWTLCMPDKKTLKHRLPDASEELLLNQAEWIRYTPEQTLWDEPELDKEVQRLRRGAELTPITVHAEWGAEDNQPKTVFGFTSEYVQRLDAYDRGRGRWNPLWKDREEQALTDISRIKASLCVIWRRLLWLWAFCLTWKSRPPKRSGPAIRKPYRLLSGSETYRTPSADARGPPHERGPAPIITTYTILQRITSRKVHVHPYLLNSIICHLLSPSFAPIHGAMEDWSTGLLDNLVENSRKNHLTRPFSSSRIATSSVYAESNHDQNEVQKIPSHLEEYVVEYSDNLKRK